MSKLHAGAVAVAALALLFGCTPSVAMTPTQPTASSTGTDTASPASPTTTPSPTWDADQLAAIDVLDRFQEASRRISADPASFTEKQMRTLLRQSADERVTDAAVESYLQLKKRGWRYAGDTTVVRTIPMKPSELSYGIEVVVTRCTDQSGLTVVDHDGKAVPESEAGYALPKFNLRQFTLQKRTNDDHFLVYGHLPVKGECGP